MTRTSLALIAATLLLTACDQVGQRLGLDDPAKKEARQDGEGRAVGSACRQSGRAIEDCYSVYYWLPKASIFAGWREMNDYMLANKLEIVQPRFEPPGSPEEMRKKRAKPVADANVAEGKASAKDEAKAAAGESAKPEEAEGAKLATPAAAPTTTPAKGAKKAQNEH